MSWARVAELVPDASGGYRAPEVVHDLGDGYSSVVNGWVSSDGYDEMCAQARVLEDCADALEALSPYLGKCQHGLDIEELMESEGWHWSVNDYVEFAHNHRATELVLILGGFHDSTNPNYPFPYVYCIPWAFNPAGVLYPW